MPFFFYYCHPPVLMADLFVSQITAVCNFFTYIRYIQQGLVKQQDGEAPTGLGARWCACGVT